MDMPPTSLEMAQVWLKTGPLNTLPVRRELLLFQLNQLCFGGRKLVSREEVKEGLQKSGIIEIVDGRMNYDNTVPVDKVLAALAKEGEPEGEKTEGEGEGEGEGEEEEEKEKTKAKEKEKDDYNIAVREITERIARWIRGSCMGDLYFIERDFDDHIDSLIEPPSLVSLFHQLINEGLVSVQDNMVRYPHLKEASPSDGDGEGDEESEGDRPSKKIKMEASNYDYDIKLDDDDANDGGEEREEHEMEHDENSEHGTNDESNNNKDNNNNNEKIEECNENIELRESDEEEENEPSGSESKAEELKEKEVFVDISKEPSKYTFKDMDFNEKIVTALQEKGIEKCTNVQTKLITSILDGKHILCQSPAGSGKTTAYILTLLQRIDPKYHPAQLLILTPNNKDAPGQSTNHVASVLGAFCPLLDIKFRNAGEEKDKLTAHVIIGSAANICDLVSKRVITLRDVKTVVFHDTDQLLSPSSETSTFDAFRECAGATQVICICQSLEKQEKKALDTFRSSFLSNASFFSIFFPSSSSTRQSFPFIRSHVFIHCNQRGRDKEISEMVKIIKEEKGVIGKKIIVMATRLVDCEEAFKELNRRGMMVGFVKLGLPRKDIAVLLNKFRESDMNILIVQGGVDLGDLTTQVVINLAIQPKPAKYLQRTQNCGRDGANGVIYNIVPWGMREKVRTSVQYHFNI